jgi:hypothetical protein
MLDHFGNQRAVELIKRSNSEDVSAADETQLVRVDSAADSDCHYLHTQCLQLGNGVGDLVSSFGTNTIGHHNQIFGHVAFVSPLGAEKSMAQPALMQKIQEISVSPCSSSLIWQTN